MKFNYCQDVLIGDSYECYDYKCSNCDECNVFKAYEYGLLLAESGKKVNVPKQVNEVVRFISEETPLSTFMKRNVADASKSCFELCDRIKEQFNGN